MKIVFVLGLVLLINSTVNFQDPVVMNIVRSLFIAMNLAIYFMWTRIKEQVASSPNGETTIWMKQSAAPSVASFMNKFFGDDKNTPATYEPTTYKEMEGKKVDAALSQAITGPLMNIAMSMFMGLHMPLALQLALTPYNAYEDPIVRKYILGFTEDTPYGEKLTDPAVAAAPAIMSAAPATEAVEELRPGEQMECEEAIFRAWESKDPAEMGMFDHLTSTGKPVTTYRTVKDGWSALMVVAGGKQNGKKEVHHLLELGCSCTLQDTDGWTALHWAAFHNCPLAIEAICGSFSDDFKAGVAHAGGKAPLIGDLNTLGCLLRIKDKDGNTALQIAQREIMTECETALLSQHQRAGAQLTDASDSVATAGSD
jgi:hypothetical protein